MNKPFFITAASILGGVLALGAWWMFVSYQNKQFDESSAEFCLTASNLVLSNLDYKLLRANSTETYLKTMPDEDLRRYFDFLKILGNYEQISNMTGEAQDRLMFNRSEAVVANYVLDARFSRSEARVYVDLILVEGQWKFDKFSVISDMTEE